LHRIISDIKALYIQAVAEISVTDAVGGHYGFQMPACGITIKLMPIISHARQLSTGNFAALCRCRHRRRAKIELKTFLTPQGK
jgi:hypothetical protein